MVRDGNRWMKERAMRDMGTPAAASWYAKQEKKRLEHLRSIKSRITNGTKPADGRPARRRRKPPSASGTWDGKRGDGKRLELPPMNFYQQSFPGDSLDPPRQARRASPRKAVAPRQSPMRTRPVPSAPRRAEDAPYLPPRPMDASDIYGQPLVYRHLAGARGPERGRYPPHDSASTDHEEVEEGDGEYSDDYEGVQDQLDGEMASPHDSPRRNPHNQHRQQHQVYHSGRAHRRQAGGLGSQRNTTGNERIGRTRHHSHMSRPGYGGSVDDFSALDMFETSPRGPPEQSRMMPPPLHGPRDAVRGTRRSASPLQLQRGRNDEQEDEEDEEYEDEDEPVEYQPPALPPRQSTQSRIPRPVIGRARGAKGLAAARARPRLPDLHAVVESEERVMRSESAPAKPYPRENNGISSNSDAAQRRPGHLNHRRAQQQALNEKSAPRRSGSSGVSRIPGSAQHPLAHHARQVPGKRPGKAVESGREEKKEGMVVVHEEHQKEENLATFALERTIRPRQRSEAHAQPQPETRYPSRENKHGEPRSQHRQQRSRQQAQQPPRLQATGAAGEFAGVRNRPTAQSATQQATRPLQTEMPVKPSAAEATPRRFFAEKLTMPRRHQFSKQRGVKDLKNELAEAQSLLDEVTNAPVGALRSDVVQVGSPGTSAPGTLTLASSFDFTVVDATPQAIIKAAAEKRLRLNAKLDGDLGELQRRRDAYNSWWREKKVGLTPRAEPQVEEKVQSEIPESLPETGKHEALGETQLVAKAQELKKHGAEVDSLAVEGLNAAKEEEEVEKVATEALRAAKEEEEEKLAAGAFQQASGQEVRRLAAEALRAAKEEEEEKLAAGAFQQASGEEVRRLAAEALHAAKDEEEVKRLAAEALHAAREKEENEAGAKRAAEEDARAQQVTRDEEVIRSEELEATCRADAATCIQKLARGGAARVQPDRPAEHAAAPSPPRNENTSSQEIYNREEFVESRSTPQHHAIQRSTAAPFGTLLAPGSAVHPHEPTAEHKKEEEAEEEDEDGYSSDEFGDPESISPSPQSMQRMEKEVSTPAAVPPALGAEEDIVEDMQEMEELWQGGAGKLQGGLSPVKRRVVTRTETMQLKRAAGAPVSLSLSELPAPIIGSGGFKEPHTRAAATIGGPECDETASLGFGVGVGQFPEEW